MKIDNKLYDTLLNVLNNQARCNKVLCKALEGKDQEIERIKEENTKLEEMIEDLENDLHLPY